MLIGALAAVAGYAVMQPKAGAAQHIEECIGRGGTGDATALRQECERLVREMPAR